MLLGPKYTVSVRIAPPSEPDRTSQAQAIGTQLGNSFSARHLLITSSSLYGMPGANHTASGSYISVSIANVIFLTTRASSWARESVRSSRKQVSAGTGRRGVNLPARTKNLHVRTPTQEQLTTPDIVNTVSARKVSPFEYTLGFELEYSSDIDIEEENDEKDDENDIDPCLTQKDEGNEKSEMRGEEREMGGIIEISSTSSLSF